MKLRENIIEFTYPDALEIVLEDILPIPAKLCIPDWFKKLNHTREIPTIKGCIPFLDTLTSGYIIKLPQDFYIKHNVYNEKIKSNDSFNRFGFHMMGEMMYYKNINLNSSNDEYHSPLQLEGCPLVDKNKKLPFYKIMNPYTIKTPPGYSCLFVSPLNNNDDRFEIIAGIVDTDVYNGEVNFPLTINGDKYPSLETTIERGTPIVQVIPFKRENWKIKYRMSSLKERDKSHWSPFSKIIHKYKTLFWRKKSWN